MCRSSTAAGILSVFIVITAYVIVEYKDDVLMLAREVVNEITLKCMLNRDSNCNI